MVRSPAFKPFLDYTAETKTPIFMGNEFIKEVAALRRLVIYGHCKTSDGMGSWGGMKGVGWGRAIRESKLASATKLTEIL